MPEKTIVTLTDQPEKWATNKHRNNSNINFIITNSINKDTLSSAISNTDLLIVSQHNNTPNTLDIQSLSAFVGAPYALFIPPDKADEFVERDLARVTSSLFSNPVQTTEQASTSKKPLPSRLPHIWTASCLALSIFWSTDYSLAILPAGNVNRYWHTCCITTTAPTFGKRWWRNSGPMYPLILPAIAST